jgi:hypothetical protein
VISQSSRSAEVWTARLSEIGTTWLTKIGTPRLPDVRTPWLSNVGTPRLSNVWPPGLSDVWPSRSPNVRLSRSTDIRPAAAGSDTVTNARARGQRTGDVAGTRPAPFSGQRVTWTIAEEFRSRTTSQCAAEAGRGVAQST